MQPDYFDVLPLHPSPHPLESLTSYLTRLAVANRITTIYRLRPLLFPDCTRDSIQEMRDFPLHSLTPLSIAAHCPEAVLQTLSFYHLLKKFGRPASSLAAVHFLSAYLAPGLRYCPLCLQTDHPYYLLPWRLFILTGCPQHGCRLLDRCSCCGYEIPLLKAPLKMNRCYQCGTALSDGRVEPLDDIQLHRDQVRYRDMVFLLSPPQDEIELGTIGPRLAYWRKAKQETAKTVANHLGILPRTVSTLERRIPRGGLKFGNYLAYSDYLGLTFEELFNTALTPEEEGYHQFLSRKQRSQQRENELLNRIQQAVDHIHEQGTHITQARVSCAIDTPRPSLEPYPKIKAVLAKIKQESQEETLLHNQQLDQEWVEKVDQAIASLQAEGKPVTQTAISQLLNRHRQGFLRYPRARAIMTAVSQAYRQQMQQQMEKSLQEMITNVQQSIVELKAQGEPITKLAVARRLGVSRGFMNYHPELRVIFAQCAEWKERPGRKRQQ